MNEIVKLTLSEIQNNPPLINKKFLLINSLFYTDDAFNYLLSLGLVLVFLEDLVKIGSTNCFY